jgi:hypothetical protein
MPNYKETLLQGTKYQRACRITIDNPLDQTPSVTFIEEEVILNSDNTRSHKIIGSLSMTFDPNEIVTIIDPITNLPTDKKYPTLIAQLIIYSMYWKKALERDNK